MKRFLFFDTNVTAGNQGVRWVKINWLGQISQLLNRLQNVRYIAVKRHQAAREPGKMISAIFIGCSIADK